VKQLLIEFGDDAEVMTYLPDLADIVKGNIRNFSVTILFKLRPEYMNYVVSSAIANREKRK